MALHPEPTEFTAGDTFRFLKTVPEFNVDEDTTVDPVTDGYSLSYALRGSAGLINITATVSGTDYLVNVLATTTANWNAGFYSWEAYVSLGSNRYLVDSGSITIETNLATAAAGDTRTFARRTLAVIEACIAGRAVNGINNYSYAGRSVSKMTVAELLQARNALRIEVNNEEAAERIAKGIGSGRNVFVRFGVPT